MKIEVPDWLVFIITGLALCSASALAGVFIGYTILKLLEILGI